MPTIGEMGFSVKHYIDAPDKPDGLDTADLSDGQRADPSCKVRPRYWVDECHVLARIARVPNRVASAWLAWHVAVQSVTSAAPTRRDEAELCYALKNCSDKLTLALASWVAGVLFHQAAGEPRVAEPETPTGTASLFDELAQPESGAPTNIIAIADWDSKTAWTATQTAERLLFSNYPVLSAALKESSISGKKALPAFKKWALLDGADSSLSLSEDELGQLQSMDLPVNGSPALQFVDVWMDRRSPRWLMGWRDICRATDMLSVITQFDGLMFTLRDGQGGKDLQQNGTGIATGAVLAMSD